jgi:transposase InsO family protein
LAAFCFPIQRIQTDWGTEFFNDYFQEELMCHFIKFRPIKPRTPHLNGKIERCKIKERYNKVEVSIRRDILTLRG